MHCFHPLTSWPLSALEELKPSILDCSTSSPQLILRPLHVWGTETNCLDCLDPSTQSHFSINVFVPPAAQSRPPVRKQMSDSQKSLTIPYLAVILPESPPCGWFWDLIPPCFSTRHFYWCQVHFIDINIFDRNIRHGFLFPHNNLVNAIKCSSVIHL